MSQLSQLKWHCRRGVKELDIVLNKYLEDHYVSATDLEKDTFRELLELEDPVLFAKLIGNDAAENPQQQKLLDKLRNLFGSTTMT